MEKIILKAIALALLTTLVCSTKFGAPPCGGGCVTPGDLSAAIRESIASDANSRRQMSIRRLYQVVAYEALWIVDGRVTPQGTQVLDYIANIEARGLRPDDYHIDELKALVNDLDSIRVTPARLAGVDLAMSLAVMRVLSDLHRGRVNPAESGVDLERVNTLDLLAVIVDASRSERVAPVIESVEPKYPDYAALIQALSTYRDIAREARPPVVDDPGRVVRHGEVYPGAPELARLLAMFGDFTDSVPAAGVQLYDSARVHGILSFQRRHGLEPDGVLGSGTMAALRVPVGERIRQIELALERWRWLPHEIPERYIMVNVPEFKLRAYDGHAGNSAPVLTLNVIVGSARRRHFTPVFAASLQTVVFHPFWDVPLTIARKELLPLSTREPSYLADGGFEIVQGTGEAARVSPLTEENLARVASGALRIRQRPGAFNALGRVKLVFPNRHGVFLHDTPERGLFTRVRRDFSHGCIRVERPGDLAEFALAGESGWDVASVRASLEGTRTENVSVTRPLTVFIQYFTASVDERGTVNFHPDLYLRDQALIAALARSPD